MDADADPGPVDKSVLYDQDKHVSSAVWNRIERGSLRCHEHTSKLHEWRLTQKQIEFVEKAGFGYLRLIPKITLDCSLISALVERWRPETNTFHLNVGEITVTLKDVALLLGLAIDGEPVLDAKDGKASLVIERLLGKTPPGSIKGKIALYWLKDCFSECPEDGTSEEIEQYTRAYLLYLVGCAIFPTSENKVSVKFLPLFENFDQAGKYAWGAAALAFLYRALGNAALQKCETISCCLTLLQCWSYYHLNIGRPHPNQDPIHDLFPLVRCWKERQKSSGTKGDLFSYRKALDLLKPCDVEWLPYKNVDIAIIPEYINCNLMLGQSKTMLICFEIAERHLPDRCLRQFNMPQPIPMDVQHWKRKISFTGNLKENIKLEVDEWSVRGDHIENSGHGVEESEYMQWYLNITRKFVGRPTSLASDFQRTVVAVREIADIADAISVEGLHDEGKDLILKIRDSAHKFLINQVGASEDMKGRRKKRKKHSLKFALTLSS